VSRSQLFKENNLKENKMVPLMKLLLYVPLLVPNSSNSNGKKEILTELISQLPTVPLLTLKLFSNMVNLEKLIKTLISELELTMML
jgi:hypothetical protein